MQEQAEVPLLVTRSIPLLLLLETLCFQLGTGLGP